MAASFLRLAVQLARDASDALESNEIVMLVVEELPDEVMNSWWEASLPGGMAASPVMPREGILWAANSWPAMLVGPYCSNLPLK